MPNIIKPAFVDEYVLVPQAGKCLRARNRKYRIVSPKSNVDMSLFNTKTKNSIHDFSSSHFWTPPIQTNRVFLRNFIQDKLHKVIYDFLKLNVVRPQRLVKGQDPFASSSSSSPVHRAWQIQAPCGHPLFSAPVHYQFGDELLFEYDNRKRSVPKYYGYSSRPPWRP